MKKQLLSLALFAALGVAQAQNVVPLYTTSPSPVIDGTGSVSFTFDVVSGSLASPGFTGDLYMYTGIDILPNGAASPTTWAHVRRPWGNVADDAVYKLTAAGTNKFTYTIPNLRSFYGLGADTQIVAIKIVLRNAAGDAQAGDLAISVNQGSPATGIAKNSSANVSLSVYPNPANDNLSVNFVNANNEKAALTLVNVIGQTVISKNEVENSTNLSLATLPAGVYFLKVNVGTAQLTKRIVKE